MKPAPPVTTSNPMRDPVFLRLLLLFGLTPTGCYRGDRPLAFLLERRAMLDSFRLFPTQIPPTAHPKGYLAASFYQKSSRHCQLVTLRDWISAGGATLRFPRPEPNSLEPDAVTPTDRLRKWCFRHAAQAPSVCRRRSRLHQAIRFSMVPPLNLPTCQAHQ